MCDRQYFEKLWHDTLDATHADPRALREISKAALEAYPNDPVFLLRAAVDEEQLAQMTTDDQEKRQHLQSALIYSQRQLGLEPENEDAKLRAVRVLSALGRDEEAMEMAHRCKSKEIALRCCLKGDALRRHKQTIIDRKLRSLLAELMEEECLDAAEGILRAAIPDGNYQHYGEAMKEIYLQRARFLTRRGCREGAMAQLRQVLALAKASDARTDRCFTAPLLDMLESVNPPERFTAVERWVMGYILAECPGWEQDESLSALMEEAKAALPKKDKG